MTTAQKLAKAKKEVEKLTAQLEKENLKKESSKPKPAYETANTLPAIYKHLKINPKTDSLKIAGFDEEDYECIKNLITRMRICKVYNEGNLPAKNERWHPWHTISSAGAGLVFNGSYYGDDCANASSASRLSFLDKNRSDAYAKNFMSVEEGIIQL
jgi:hypothetical protein